MSGFQDEAHLRACLAVMADTVAAARFMARRAASQDPAGQREVLDQIARLMDAIHNVPKFAMADNDDFRNWAYDAMKAFDERQGAPYLTLIYDRERAAP